MLYELVILNMFETSVNFRDDGDNIATRTYKEERATELRIGAKMKKFLSQLN